MAVRPALIRHRAPGRPAVVRDQEGEGELAIAKQMTLTLSCDHRVIDGVLGAKLLGQIVHLLENPIAMVM